MFYSHEVLTSRKYGVATVWLVATLGQKSTARKVTRRAILDVDVPKACETVITPEAPMALRLQSSLLYGISRVYAQQCGYVLADAQHAQNAIRTLFKVVQAAQLDSSSAKARPDQITLQDDPAFVPGFNFGSTDSDLLDLEIGRVGPQRYISETMSLHTSQSQTSISQVGLQLPSSSSFDMGPGFMLSGSGSHGPRPSSLLGREDGGVLLPEIDIGLDAEGNFIEFDDAPVGRELGSGLLLPSGSGAHGEERMSGQQPSGSAAPARQLPEDDIQLPDDGYTFPAAETGISSGSYHALHESTELPDTSSTAAAPLRRKARVPKTIPLDKTIELRNRDLLAMNTEYMQRMADDWKRIAASKATAQAKKNADYWILGRGILGVADDNGLWGPLAETWSGDNLYLLLTGRERLTKGKKRGSDDEQDDERRVRPRLDDIDQPVFAGGDDTLMENYDLEVGREGQDPLEDISSAMPWNISASIRGSSVQRGAPGSATGSLTRRGSRLVSASPLVGRGVGLPEASDAIMAGFDDVFPLGNDDDFELYGPGADVDTQTAGQSQWQRAVLDRESGNFLEFVAGAIENQKDGEKIDFAQLLPPETNSKTVAAQGLLHVLTLATKDLIRVEQKMGFGAIAMWVR